MQQPEVLSYDEFEAEGLNVIWHEIQHMAVENTANVGVVFESGGQDFSIAYVRHSILMGQSDRYPASLWRSICLSMRLIGQLADKNGWQGLVNLSEGVGFSSVAWAIYPEVVGDTPLSLLPIIFERVDDVITLLNKPLDFPLPAVLDHGTCPHCSAPLIPRDGDDLLYCPAGCLI